MQIGRCSVVWNRAGALGLSLALLPVTGCGGESRGASALDESSAEAAWEVLFDGSDLSHWRGYQRDDVPAGWQIQAGELAFVPGGDGGDLITREQYGDFELELEWRVSEGANSGIFYRGTEDGRWIWQTAPEYQVLDNEGHPDGVHPAHTAAANYGLHVPTVDATRPVGEWNHTRIVARGPHIEHWLNGEKVVEYAQGSAEWQQLVAESKFNEMPGYGRYFEGHIGLQDHGDPVWFRNIRIRPLVAAP